MFPSKYAEVCLGIKIQENSWYFLKLCKQITRFLAAEFRGFVAPFFAALIMRELIVHWRGCILFAHLRAEIMSVMLHGQVLN